MRRALVRAVVGMMMMTLATEARAQQAPDQTPNNDPWFGHDKLLHFEASASIAVVTYAASSFKTDHRPTRAAAAFCLALGAGIAKETWDLTGHGDASWRDLTWDVVGATTGTLIAYAIDWAVSRLRGHSPAGETGR
jgi:putative lipoprotein